jgi:hypothetical protein
MQGGVTITVIPEHGDSLTYADVCCRMLTYADVCRRMQGAVTITVIPEHGDAGPGPITLHWGVGVKSATDWQVERHRLNTALIQP